MLSYKLGLSVLVLGCGLFLQFNGINSQQLIAPPWDGICPNNTANLSAFDWGSLNGTWYLFGASQQIYSGYFRCFTRNITVTNGSIYFVDSYYSVSTKQQRTATGEYLIDYQQNLIYLLQTTPFESIIPFFWLPVNSTKVHGYYACNECGFYGTQDSGVKYYVFVRDQFPDCLTTQPIDDAIGNFQISLVDHRNCTITC